MRFFGTRAERAAIDVLAIVAWAEEFVKHSNHPVPDIPSFLRTPRSGVSCSPSRRNLSHLSSTAFSRRFRMSDIGPGSAWNLAQSASPKYSLACVQEVDTAMDSQVILNNRVRTWQQPGPEKLCMEDGTGPQTPSSNGSVPCSTRALGSTSRSPGNPLLCPLPGRRPGCTSGMQTEPSSRRSPAQCRTYGTV